MKKYIIWLLSVFILISCGRDNFDIAGEIEEDIPDPIEIDDVFLTGTVQNEFGQRIPDVNIHLHNEAGDVLETTSNEDGQFNFESIQDLTETFRIVYFKEDHYTGLVDLQIEEILDESSVDIILFSDLTGVGGIDIENPYNNDLVLIEGQISNYDPSFGFIIFEAVSVFGEYFTYGFTDYSGRFQLWIPPGLDFQLYAFDACHNPIFTGQFEGVFENLTDFNIEISAPQDSGLTKVFGNVVDCITGQAIESGIMLISFDQSFHQEVSISDGYFELEVYECLLGTTVEIFPQIDAGPSFPIYISTDQYLGEEEWNLGLIELCSEFGGYAELLINGVDSVFIEGLIGLRIEDQLILFSEEMLCELVIDDDQIESFNSIQISTGNFDKYIAIADEDLMIEIEVEEFSGIPGSPLVMSFFGQFIDQNSFQLVNISGHINTIIL